MFRETVNFLFSDLEPKLSGTETGQSEDLQGKKKTNQSEKSKQNGKNQEKNFLKMGKQWVGFCYYSCFLQSCKFWFNLNSETSCFAVLRNN